jgi:hypothetical protein
VPAVQADPPEVVGRRDPNTVERRGRWREVPFGAVYAPGAPGADDDGTLRFPGLVPRAVVDAILGRRPWPAARAVGPSGWISHAGEPGE